MSFTTTDLSWINTGLLVTILVGSALGLVLIVSLFCCLFKQKRAGAEQDKSKGVGYNGSEKEEYGSRAIRGLTPDLCPPVGSQDYCNSPAPWQPLS
ncbi:hypothetical protein NQZ68_007981 [Dissostichus eleginoides]|nr:hypothetical protein NQZ68_007981 [Dissostichus eleginoides]